MKPIKIVLAGQPNVGKSSLINAISDARLKVGNFSGVTVEKTEICFEHHCHQVQIIDLPGTYSLDGFSQEEKVARDYIVHEEYDLILNVIDSTHITRNLLLTLELLNQNKKMVIALNMIDEAHKEGISIDAKQIEAITGIPTIAVSSNTKEGIEKLLETVHNIADDKIRLKSKISYSDAIEEEIFTITKFFEDKSFRYKDLDCREMAIRMLSEDKLFYKAIHEEPIFMELQPILLESINNLYIYFETKDIKDIESIEHNAIARGIRAETVTCTSPKKTKSLTKQIDEILINKFAGIPIFLFLMWGLFQLTFEIGSIPMDWIDSLFVILSDEARIIISNPTLQDLIADGIIPGVGAVVMFLPNIIILYFGIAMLETTGYMSRVAFLLDGFFHKFGLHGKSFIPLVTGFGCSVPAYMSARTLKNEKDRLITLFIIGFMSCGAKLPVYVLFTGAFFDESQAGNILFIIYIAGALLGLVMAKILRLTAFKGDDEPFVMEMPKYRMPSLKLIWFTVYNKAKSYLKKAGTFILGASILIWFASNYPKNNILQDLYSAKIELAKSDEAKTQLSNELELKLLENSYLGQMGKASEPFFAPLGFDWRMSVALETGLAAKEVVVATLGILYNTGGDVDESSESLINSLRAEISFASAMAFIVFVMIYLPCLAASSVFAKEAGSYRYLAYLFLMTTGVAWVMSFITYIILK